MSDETCANCKHWDTAANLNHFENEIRSREEGEWDGSQEQLDAAEKRTKERMKAWGECKAILQKESAPDEALAMLSDGSGYYAALATRGTFGCALFAASDSGRAEDRA